jgi:hypothetical protein
MFRIMNGRFRPWIVLLLFVVLAPMLTGCYGSFQATHSVYRFNGDVSHQKFVRSVVMWVLMIVPVYELGVVVDVFVLNPLEYWKGTQINLGKGTDANGATVALAPSAGGREADLTLSRHGQLLTRATLVRVSDSEIEVRDTDGRLAGKVLRPAEGGLRLTDAEGQTIRTIAAAELASARAK